MKRFLFLLLLGVVCCLPYLGWADPVTTTPAATTDPNVAIDTGAQALTLTQNLYCGIKGAFSSPTAMFIGLALAITGLWKMIQGSVGGGIMLIICGALLGALPTLAESFLNGVGGAIGSMTNSPTITPPSSCT